MPTCGTNNLVISKPSTSPNCNTSCNDIGPADCLNSSELSPRRNRGAVIEQIKDYVLLMLGAPVVDVELDSQQLDMAVKQTLKTLEYYAPPEYFQYYPFITVPGKSIYKLPPDVGYIRNVYYREQAEFAFTAQDLNGAIPVEYFYPGGAYASIQGGLIDPIQPIWGRAGEWTLYKMYERMYSRSSSMIGGWEFIGGYSHIKLYPIPTRITRVICHYISKCYDWEEVVLMMQEGALALAKMMLGTIRKKYANLPGPSGGATLDGEAMYQEGKEEYKTWKENLILSWGGQQLPITFG